MLLFAEGLGSILAALPIHAYRSFFIPTGFWLHSCLIPRLRLIPARHVSDIHGGAQSSPQPTLEQGTQMPSSDFYPSSPSKSSRAKFILPIAGTGLLIACLFALFFSMRKTYSEAEIIRSIHIIALRQSEKPGVPNGGPLGHWWISAVKVDPITGKLFDFSITTDTMIIAAQSVMVEIDPLADTFTFDMTGVVLTRFSDSNDDEGEILVTREHYRLGPAPFGVDIIPDAGTVPVVMPKEKLSGLGNLAGVQPSEDSGNPEN